MAHYDPGDNAPHTTAGEALIMRSVHLWLPAAVALSLSFAAAGEKPEVAGAIARADGDECAGLRQSKNGLEPRALAVRAD